MKDCEIILLPAGEEKGHLILSGRFTMVNAEEIKSKLVQMVPVFPTSLEVTVKDVTELDLSFLQLMKSFICLLKTKNIIFNICWRLDEDQLNLLDSTGFSKYL